MIETVILAIIFAKIKDTEIKKILRHWEFYPVFACAIIYIFLQIDIFAGNYTVLPYSSIYKTVYSAAIFFLIYRFRIYKQGGIGIGLMFAGLVLNKLVMYFNNWKMPVFPTLSLKTGYIDIDKLNTIDGWHVVGDSSTRLKFLSDIFDTGYCVMSLGDILVRAFLFDLASIK
ncbi:hypothetical protein LY28_03752 [Ruminiclostridium sufflavum DSM 19573]|uniref:Uncharacterized protein n=1 Tax=Ruminiclostridium sufflavum DSM 19573 TaxID=1121337 RepID=A0A318XF99_9FIRM|nr:DUF5317 family protein [Ruminiclostridium sufflavum]PYG84228.1 hypothetical protein LY28_03752 [Ruminiclostridium sufflavum DSM 19573]